MLKKLGKIEESVENTKKAIEIKPNYLEAYNNYLFNIQYLTKYNYDHHISVAKKLIKNQERLFGRQIFLKY